MRLPVLAALALLLPAAAGAQSASCGNDVVVEGIEMMGGSLEGMNFGARIASRTREWVRVDVIPPQVEGFAGTGPVSLSFSGPRSQLVLFGTMWATGARRMELVRNLAGMVRLVCAYPYR